MVALRDGAEYDGPPPRKRPPKAPKGPKAIPQPKPAQEAGAEPPAPVTQKQPPKNQPGNQRPKQNKQKRKAAKKQSAKSTTATGQGAGTGAAGRTPKDNTQVASRSQTVAASDALLRLFKKRNAKRLTKGSRSSTQSRLVAMTKAAIARAVRQAVSSGQPQQPSVSAFVRKARGLLAKLKQQKLARPSSRAATADDTPEYVHDVKDSATMNRHATTWVAKLAALVGTLESPKMSRRFAAIIQVALKSTSGDAYDEIGNVDRRMLTALRAYLDDLPMLQVSMVRRLAELALREDNGLMMMDYLCQLEVADDESAMTLILCHTSLQVTFLLMQSLAIEMIYTEARMFYPDIDKARFVKWIAQDASGPLPTHVLSGAGPATGKVCFKCKQSGHKAKDCPK